MPSWNLVWILGSLQSESYVTRHSPVAAIPSLANSARMPSGGTLDQGISFRDGPSARIRALRDARFHFMA
jgi:hypothetical protein